MGRNEKIDDLLYSALKKGDAATFRTLVTNNPENLFGPTGTEVWLGMASSDGLLEIVKTVADLGIDVDQPESPTLPSTALLRAAEAGHLDVVKWLVEHGAQINIDCTNLPVDIRPLTGAALGGHLDVVKYLVEMGADVDTAVGGMNALMYAEMYNKADVASYLRSLGSRDARETTPKDFPASQQRMLEAMTSLYGPLSDFKLEVPGEPSFHIYATVPHQENGVQTVFTIGLSDRELKGANDKKIETEVKIFLPREWPVTKESLTDPQWNWPIQWLQKIAREALDSGTWPGGWSAIFMNCDPPQPLAPNTQLCGWLCLLHHGASYQMPDARWINDRTMFPIYAQEKELIDSAGYEELVKRFHAQGLPQHVDPQRASAC